MVAVNSSSAVHALPADFRRAIAGDAKVLALWNDITPLARNEWICWVTSGKLAETRDIRIKKGLSKMRGGMRRPCCWAGCMHRTDKKLSSSQKWVLSKSKK
jgi:uncharacterized protein YdeI (YjbR/CyaY-like superfamily)